MLFTVGKVPVSMFMTVAIESVTHKQSGASQCRKHDRTKDSTFCDQKCYSKSLSKHRSADWKHLNFQVKIEFFSEKRKQRRTVVAVVLTPRGQSKVKTGYSNLHNSAENHRKRNSARKLSQF